MPVEIREVQIKVTVTGDGGRSGAPGGGDVFRFGDAAPVAPRVMDDAAELVLFGEAADTAAKPSHHSGGVNVLMCDGSVRFAVEAMDLFG